MGSLLSLTVVIESVSGSFNANKTRYFESEDNTNLIKSSMQPCVHTILIGYNYMLIVL